MSIKEIGKKIEELENSSTEFYTTGKRDAPIKQLLKQLWDKTNKVSLSIFLADAALSIFFLISALTLGTMVFAFPKYIKATFLCYNKTTKILSVSIPLILLLVSNIFTILIINKEKLSSIFTSLQKRKKQQLGTKNKIIKTLEKDSIKKAIIPKPLKKAIIPKSFTIPKKNNKHVKELLKNISQFSLKSTDSYNKALDIFENILDLKNLDMFQLLYLALCNKENINNLKTILKKSVKKNLLLKGLSSLGSITKNIIGILGGNLSEVEKEPLCKSGMVGIFTEKHDFYAQKIDSFLNTLKINNFEKEKSLKDLFTEKKYSDFIITLCQIYIA
ncbi:MAG: hypothetical protein AMS24_03670 [Chlamydiae bacterium SM23_39]|nr:MAG: hypothetical protein AMS24_03670 [Chlamydiae bacterium SM23_39]